MKAHLHVVGGGLAGLASAFYAARAGLQVSIYEASPCFGGRFRSVHAASFGQKVDNGTHLLLGANRHMLSFLHQTGCQPHLLPAPPLFHLLGRAGENRRITPFSWPMGWREMATALWGAKGSVQQHLSACPHAALWHSLAVSVMNTSPDRADHPMFARVLRRILRSGPLSLRPYLFHNGLSAVVDAILDHLGRLGCRLYPLHRWQGFERGGMAIKNRPSVPLGAQDRVILALPPAEALPCQPIITIHYRLPPTTGLDIPVPFAALTGGLAHWLSLRDGILSLTLSAAQDALHCPDLAAQVWQQCRIWLNRPDLPLPPSFIIREKRATLCHDLDTLARRPAAITPWPHVWRAGDWLQSPWPCTMEAAIGSARRAVRLVLDTV